MCFSKTLLDGTVTKRICAPDYFCLYFSPWKVLSFMILRSTSIHQDQMCSYFNDTKRLSCCCDSPSCNDSAPPEAIKYYKVEFELRVAVSSFACLSSESVRKIEANEETAVLHTLLPGSSRQLERSGNERDVKSREQRMVRERRSDNIYSRCCTSIIICCALIINVY